MPSGLEGVAGLLQTSSMQPVPTRPAADCTLPVMYIGTTLALSWHYFGITWHDFELHAELSQSSVMADVGVEPDARCHLHVLLCNKHACGPLCEQEGVGRYSRVFSLHLKALYMLDTRLRKLDNAIMIASRTSWGYTCCMSSGKSMSKGTID